MAKHTIHYTVDGKQQTADVTERTATEILESAGENPADKFLIEICDERRESYHDHPHRAIHLRDGQVFETSRRNVHFTVDGEVTTSRDHDLAPTKIMELGGVDPKNHYLKRMSRHNEESFRGNADVAIHIDQNDSFITLMMAPCPVS